MCEREREGGEGAGERLPRDLEARHRAVASTSFPKAAAGTGGKSMASTAHVSGTWGAGGGGRRSMAGTAHACATATGHSATGLSAAADLPLVVDDSD